MATRPPTHTELLGRGRSDSDRAYDATRQDDPTWAALRTARWRRVRDRKLTRDPLCEDCLLQGRRVVARQVDHVIPRRQRPDLIFEIANLRSLCTMHHGKKSAEERRLGA
jgi:5-methylcytosine-specific restriction protein A